MVKPGLIGSAHPRGLDMIGCIHLLEMAVMIAGFLLRQIRVWKYETRLNDTGQQADHFSVLLPRSQILAQAE